MNKGEIARNYFKSGVNCAQAVALAFKDELNMSEEQIKKIMIGFGGGFGRQRLICGAVSGMTMVLSYLKSDGEDKLKCYELIQKACADFKAEFGTLICAELLEGKVKVTTNPNPDARTKEYYAVRPCDEICAVAANIAQKYGGE